MKPGAWGYRGRAARCTILIEIGARDIISLGFLDDSRDLTSLSRVTAPPFNRKYVALWDGIFVVADNLKVLTAFKPENFTSYASDALLLLGLSKADKSKHDNLSCSVVYSHNFL